MVDMARQRNVIFRIFPESGVTLLPVDPHHRPTKRQRRRARSRAILSVGGAVAIVGLLLSVFANGTGRQGAPATATSTPPSQNARAQESCTDFDQATTRLAANDNKGFIDAMTLGSSAAQQAAASDPQWQSLVVGFTAFVTDLTANDSTKVFNDLNAINQICTVVRGPRTLNLRGR